MKEWKNERMKARLIRRHSKAMRRKAGSTLRSSRAVPHPSTNRALRRLTSEVGRDPVYSTRYGRQRQPCQTISCCTSACEDRADPSAECRSALPRPHPPFPALSFPIARDIPDMPGAARRARPRAGGRGAGGAGDAQATSAARRTIRRPTRQKSCGRSFAPHRAEPSGAAGDNEDSNRTRHENEKLAAP